MPLDLNIDTSDVVEVIPSNSTTSHATNKRLRNGSLRQSNNNQRVANMPTSVVSDSNWPYGGAIQSATGRILFQFEATGDSTFLCSGTVIKDYLSGRSIILTAAHCVYSDQHKQFASYAVFIPDQVSTRGTESDFDCYNDKYGCWLMSFGIVDEGWAEGSFPNNVDHDYAFYVVHDHASTHSGGYSQGLSGTLDNDVSPLELGFNTEWTPNEFIVALGYSSEADPSLRYCSNGLSGIRAVGDYINLYLKDCGMANGASGGPWVVDMNENGVGTIVSLTSWKLTDSSGIAGPDLLSANGSKARCMFKKARRFGDPGVVGGYVVNC